MAALSDLFSGADLAAASSVLGSYAGMGVIAGPFIGGQLVARTGNAKLPFLVASCLAAAQLAPVYTKMPETLAPENRKDFDAAAASPFSFMHLFGVNKDLTKLVVAGGLQCFPEGKNVADFNQVTTVCPQPVCP